MLHSFTYETSAGRVIFGEGSLAQLPQEVLRLGLKRVLVISTPEQAQQG
jgi:maleylacetate reductase